MRRMLERTAAFAILALAGGCSGPAPAAVQLSEPFFTAAPATGFDVLRRTDGLATDVAETRLIGPAGGSIEIRGAGVTLVIPPLALAEETEITVTALAGAPVAFEFAPHGLRFAVPAEVRISSAGTAAEELVRSLPGVGRRHVSSLMGVYFEGDPASGVEPLENIDTWVHDWDIVFEIRHFSGYACASG